MAVQADFLAVQVDLLAVQIDFQAVQRRQETPGRDFGDILGARALQKPSKRVIQSTKNQGFS